MRASGWAICDGTTGTPDLRGRFLRGVGSLADAGPVGDPHLTDLESGGSDSGDKFHIAPVSSDFVVPGLNHTHKVPLPPHYKIVFIMKL